MFLMIGMLISIPKMEETVKRTLVMTFKNKNKFKKNNKK